MKRIVTFTAVIFCTFSVFAQKVSREDFAGLTASNHPRILFTDDDFKALPKLINENENVMLLHETFAKMANSTSMNGGMSKMPLVFEKDASNKRTKWNQATLSRISSDAYMFRITGDRKYLEHAEADMNTVCDYPEWNPDHYLDVAHEALGIAIGYDWLYDYLSPDTKAKAEKAIVEFAFEPSKTKYAWFYKRDGNWNQVCNDGLVTAALAIYETAPDICFDIIKRGVETNMRAMKIIYGPDGIFPEGPGYWTFGTMHQVMMIQALECAVGKDFGLSEVQGFDKTAYFKVFSSGPIGLTFNFGDNKAKDRVCMPLWYFARRFGDPSLVYGQLEKLKKKPADILTFLALYEAMRIKDEIKPMSGRKLFYGSGNGPLIMARTGWGKDDLFFGLKGGTGGFLHGHLDVGGVVFDAKGCRWIGELDNPPYTKVEKPLEKQGGSYWSMAQESARWRLLYTNNRWHSTLTVNDRDHCCTGKGEVSGTFETARSYGGSMDITPVFFDDLRSAVRTCSIENGSYLKICDAISTRDDRGAHIRFTLITETEPTVTSSGIILKKDGKTARIKTSGAKVTYRIWSTNPSDYPERRTEEFEPSHKGFSAVGFEVDIPAGRSVNLITTVKP